MKKLYALIVIISMAISVSANQADSTIIRSGNTFIKTQQVKEAKATAELTSYMYQIKDVDYPIYITSNGRCYIIRTSKNGNEYKQYVPENVARLICLELGREYKEPRQEPLGK